MSNDEFEIMDREKAMSEYGYHPDSIYGDPFSTLDESFRKRELFESSSIFKELDQQWIDKTLHLTYQDDQYWVICHGVKSFDGSLFWYFILPFYGDIIVYDRNNEIIITKKRFWGYLTFNAVIVEDHVYFLIPNRNGNHEEPKVGRFSFK
jgi:hypothetical protein